MKNINETVLLVASIQGFLLFLGLITKKTTNKLSNVAISILIFLVTITLLFSWGSATRYNSSPNAIPFWTLQSYLLIPASFWLFFETNTNPTFSFHKKHFLLFFPALVDITVQIFFRFLPAVYNNLVFLAALKSPFWFFIVEILPLFTTIFILGFYARKLWLMKQKLKAYNNLVLLAYFQKMIFISVSLFLLLMVWAASTYYLIQYQFVEIALVTFIFLLGYVAYFKPDFFEIPKDILLRNQSVNPFSNFDDEASLHSLNSIFVEQFVHLRPKLTVSEVANELNLPAKYVSFLITNYHAKNFNDFVNGFRVNEVMARITDPAHKHKSLLGIALDSGFNSKSSFNQVFKLHTGKTPSEYLHQMSPES